MNKAEARKLVAELDQDVADLEAELRKARNARDHVAERYGLSPSRPSRSPSSSDREGTEESESGRARQAAPATDHPRPGRRPRRDPRSNQVQTGADSTTPIARGGYVEVSRTEIPPSDPDDFVFVRVRKAGDVG